MSKVKQAIALTGGLDSTSAHTQELADVRALRRLLVFGIPLFWSAVYIYNSYLSVYARSLGASLSLVGVIVGTYGFTQLVLRIPLGIASDRLGKRKPFVLLGALAGAASSAALLIAPQPWVLILSRAMAGIASACWVALSVLLVTSYPQEQALKAASLTAALSGAGCTLSSALGGQIAQFAGIRVPFALGIVLGLVAMVLLAQIKEPRLTADKPASLSSLLSVGRVRMVLIVSLLAMVGQYVSWGMTFSFVPIYAAELQATKSQLGWLMSAWQGCAAMASYAAGHVAARLGVRRTVVMGLALVALGTLLVPITRDMTVLLVLRLVHGAGHGVTYPILMGGALLAVPAERRGAAMGFFQAIYAVGMVAGPSVSGVFADHLGLIPTFYMTGLLAVLSAVAAALLLPHHIRMAQAPAT
jgi:MFS family permease